MDNNVLALFECGIVRRLSEVEPDIVFLYITRQINHLSEVDNKVNALNRNNIKPGKKQDNLNRMSRYIDNSRGIRCDIAFSINTEQDCKFSLKEIFNYSRRSL